MRYLVLLSIVASVTPAFAEPIRSFVGEQSSSAAPDAAANMSRAGAPATPSSPSPTPSAQPAMFAPHVPQLPQAVVNGLHAAIAAAHAASKH
jgi:hypothetical protein